MFLILKICWVASVALLASCATAPEIKLGVTSVSGNELMLQSKPEPVYSTSYAINLAGLALKNQGVHYEGRNIMVSFCDGVYTVTFEKPQGQTMFCDYLVDIDANTSKILNVVTTK